MCTNMFVWLLKILCQTFIAFDKNNIIYSKKNILFLSKKLQQYPVINCKIKRIFKQNNKQNLYTK